jgi:DNA-binding response OmpR family regulator
MPIKSGLDLLKALRDKEMAPRFLLLSAHVDQTAQEAALALGASAIIRKPVKRQELLEHVVNALSNPKCLSYEERSTENYKLLIVFPYEKFRDFSAAFCSVTL